MADKVLSVEIGYSLTKVCEIDRTGKTPKILNSFVIDTPEDMTRDGLVMGNALFTEAFRGMLSAKKIKTKKVIFTLTSSRMVSKEVTIPFVKENKIQDIVRANLSDYFPIDPKQYVFSHSVIGIVREENKSIQDAEKSNADDVTNDAEAGEGIDGKKKKPVKAPKETLGKATGYKLQVLAAPKQLIQSYENLAKELGLEFDSVDHNGNSIYQAVKEECKQGVQLIIKIDERNALLMVMDNGSVALNRTIPYGINEAITTLQGTTGFGNIGTYEKALEFARRRTCILSNFNGDVLAVDSDDDNSSDIIKADKAAVTESLRTLVGGIRRVIDYYNSNNSQNPIQKAYVTGIGADFSGISTLLSHELELKVKNLTHLAGIDIEKVFVDVTYGEYVAVIGASIAPVKFYADHDEVSKSSGKGGQGSSAGLLIAILILIIGIGVAGVLSALTYLEYKKQTDLKKQYQDTIVRLQPSYDIYLEYLALDKNIQYLKHMDEATYNRNAELVEFIEFMEREMPYTFCINSIEADYESITIDAAVGSKDEVAYVMRKLRENPMFSSSDITSVDAQENELGEIIYEFTAEMYYAPVEHEEAEEEE